MEDILCHGLREDKVSRFWFWFSEASEVQRVRGLSRCVRILVDILWTYRHRKKVGFVFCPLSQQ
jgi:hypothetical protein